jgi:hypothetical protein
MHTVNLEDGVLDRMALSPAIVAQLPFLRSLAVVLQRNAQTCGTCGHSAQDISSLRNDTKAYLAKADLRTITLFKQVLSADQIHMFYSENTAVKEAVL